jgi:hypothetical protein
MSEVSQNGSDENKEEERIWITRKRRKRRKIATKIIAVATTTLTNPCDTNPITQQRRITEDGHFWERRTC